MKPKKPKRQQSIELSQQVTDFLHSGGEVKSIPKGISGNLNNANLFRGPSQFEPKNDRTPLTEVVNTLEERKTNKSKKATPSPPVKRQKKKLIVDDFGDPIRWVWE